MGTDSFHSVRTQSWLQALPKRPALETSRCRLGTGRSNLKQKRALGISSDVAREIQLTREQRSQRRSPGAVRLEKWARLLRSGSLGRGLGPGVHRVP